MAVNTKEELKKAKAKATDLQTKLNYTERELSVTRYELDILRNFTALQNEIASMRKLISRYQKGSEIEELRDQIKSLVKVIAKYEGDLNDPRNYKQGFYDGRQYMRRTVESIVLKHYKKEGIETWEELISRNKLPAFWIAAVVTALDDPPEIANNIEVSVEEIKEKAK